MAIIGTERIVFDVFEVWSSRLSASTKATTNTRTRNGYSLPTNPIAPEPRIVTMEAIVAAAFLNQYAVSLIHRGLAGNALPFLREGIAILSRTSVIEGKALSGTEHAISPKHPGRLHAIDFVFTTESNGSIFHEPGPLPGALQNTATKVVAMTQRLAPCHEGTCACSSYDRRVCVHDDDFCCMRTVTAAVSSVLLYHVAYAYQQLGLSRNCQHTLAQATDIYDMTRTLVTTIVSKDCVNHIHTATDWFRELEQVSGHEVSRIYRIALGIAPAA
jgi:hypothetical protein